MARWKLTEPHYLNVPGTEWEQTTTDRITQRPVRKKFKVPLHLDPRIESDWNYNSEGGTLRAGDMDGVIIVAYADGKQKPGPRDIIFEGPPSPGMYPFDDEAAEISAQYNWTPTATVDNGFGAEVASEQAKILNNLVHQLADATVKGSSAVPHGFDKFMEVMAGMMAQQTKILQQLTGKQQEAEFAEELKSIDPLPEPEPPTAAEIEASRKVDESRHGVRRR